MKMFNPFKKKPLVLHFYTDRKDIFDLTKPIKASRAFPEWWKVLPKEVAGDPINPTSTMKRCAGFTELYNNGFVVPMWSDLNVDVGPIGTTGARWCYSDPKAQAGHHPAEQRGAYLPDTHYQHLKLTCPWYVVCEEDVKWVYMQPIWNSDAPGEVVVPPAIIDFKYQHHVNVNVIFPRTAEPKMHRFEYGQPMAHVIPMTERPIEYQYHLVSTEELHTYRTPHLWFVNKLTNFKKQNAKCPFGFGK